MVLRVSGQRALAAAAPQDDPLEQLLGHFGRWQLLICGTVSLVKLSSGWVQMAILFLTPNLTFWCSNFTVNFSDQFSMAQPHVENMTSYDTGILSNGSVALYADGPSSAAETEVLNNTCYPECRQYSFDPAPFHNTIVSEWSLVCARRWLASLTQMVLQLGVLLGSIVFGFLSDRFGRRSTFLGSVTAVVALGFLVPLARSFAVFTLLRFLLGAATAGSMVVSFVLVMEAVGARHRALAGCLFQIPFIIGHMTVPLFAYFYRSWDTYSLAMAVPPLMYLGYFFIVSESPRWLLSVGRLHDAAQVVTKAALMNGRPTAKIEETLASLGAGAGAGAGAVAGAGAAGPAARRPDYRALVAPRLRATTLCCAVLWLGTGVTFFGFNQYISQTSPDPCVSVAAAGAIQIPSNLAAMWLIGRLGRKVTTVTFMALAGLCIITLGCVPDIFALTLTLGSLGVSCASIVATTVYIYTSELYPTVVRNMGLGAGSTAMRLGSMLAPFVSALPAPWPSAALGLAPLLAAATCLALPETRARPLPDTLDDTDSTAAG